MSALGDRIRQRRQQLAFTQERVSAMAGISKGFLSEVENGTRRPSAENLLRVAETLGVSLDYLMKGAQEGTIPETTGKRIQFPAALATFAKERRLSFEHTQMLLEMRQQVVAHRAHTKTDDLENFDWKGFYESVKDYL